MSLPCLVPAEAGTEKESKIGWFLAVLLRKKHQKREKPRIFRQKIPFYDINGNKNGNSKIGNFFVQPAEIATRKLLKIRPMGGVWAGKSVFLAKKRVCFFVFEYEYAKSEKLPFSKGKKTTENGDAFSVVTIVLGRLRFWGGGLPSSEADVPFI